MGKPEEASKAVRLDFISGHGPGAGCAAFATVEGEVTVLSCGADRKAVLRDLATLEETKDAEVGQANYLAINPASSQAVVCNESYVKVLNLPSLEFDSAPGRSNLPVRVLTCSPDGKQWAMGGDQHSVKIFSFKGGQCNKTLHCEGFVRGLAYDPTGQYLAATQSDGLIYVWDVATPKTAWKKRVLRKLGNQSVVPCSISWHPDGGALLAMPGTENDIMIYERLSWSDPQYLVGGHTAPVVCVAYSPNGQYLASGDEQGMVCVWSTAQQKVISRAATSGTTTPSAPVQVGDDSGQLPGRCVLSMSWHPTGNGLLVMNANGQLCIWAGCVPVAPGLPGPAVPMDILEKAGSEVLAAQPGGAELEDEAAGGDGQGDDAGGDDDVSSLNDFIVQEAGDAKMNALTATGLAPVRPAAAAIRYIAPPELPCQQAFQPCSTPAAGSAPRFLSYTTLGCVTSRPVEDYHVVEVVFHDTQRLGSRVPVISDYYGFSLGCLGERGVLLGSPPSDDSASMVMYRPFDSWAPASDWTAGLPAGESVVALAAGASFAAVATSAHLLRVFSPGGVQLGVINLPGPPVALAAQGHHLAVVTLQSSPSHIHKTQKLWITAYDTSTSACTMSCACPLTPSRPGSTPPTRAAASKPDAASSRSGGEQLTCLTWITYSDRGALVVADSQGTVFIRSSAWGGSWVPVFNAADHTKGSETYWPVAVQGNQLLTIMVAPPAKHPSVVPSPFLTPLPLKQPQATVEGGAPELEGDLMMATIAMDHARASYDLGTGSTIAAAALAAAERGADTAALKLMQATLKGGRLARAYDLATTLSLSTSLTGALRLANHFRAPGLSERLTQLIEQRQEEEAAAAAAAEEAQAGAYMATAGAFTPIPMKTQAVNGRDGEGEEAAGEEAGPAAKTPLGQKAGASNAGAPGSAGPPSTGGAGALTALKQAASAATTPAGQENSQKRKSGAAQPLNNPFARRPTKQAKN